MTTARARLKLDARDREYRIGQLKKLIAAHGNDPEFNNACMGWRKELLRLRAEQAEVPLETGNDADWDKAVSHAKRHIREMKQAAASPSSRVQEVKSRYFERIRAGSRHTPYWTTERF